MNGAKPTRLLLIRHGHHDPQGRFLQHACTGLDEVGRRQARQLAEQLGQSGETVDVVLASRAARAFQTADIVATNLELAPVERTCDLCEMHPGEAEGLTLPEMRDRFGSSYRSVPGAEYFADWLPGAARRLRVLAERHRGQTVVAVTHNGIIKVSFHAFGQMPPETAEAVVADNTGITAWARSTDPSDPRRNVWTLERHNDTRHLSPVDE